MSVAAFLGPADLEQLDAHERLARLVGEPRRQLRAPWQPELRQALRVEERGQVEARRQGLGVADGQLPEPGSGSEQAEGSVAARAHPGDRLGEGRAGELQLGEPVGGQERRQLDAGPRQAGAVMGQDSASDLELPAVAAAGAAAARSAATQASR